MRWGWRVQMRTWLGGEATERIEEWRTVVYEAAGVVKAVSVEKACRACHQFYMLRSAPCNVFPCTPSSAGKAGQLFNGWCLALDHGVAHDFSGCSCRSQAAVELPEDASFEEYLARSPPEDVVTETFLDPLSLGGAPGKAPAAPADVLPITILCPGR